MPEHPVFIKEPVEKLPYTFFWTRWLGDDAIDSRVTTVYSGLTQESVVNGSKTTRVVVSGGDLGRNYLITDAITTTPSALVDHRTMVIQVRVREPLRTIFKAPEARAALTFDWADWFTTDDVAGESIASRVVTVPSGLTQYGSVVEGSDYTIVTVTGGERGKQYLVSDTITTTPSGYVAKQNVLIRVRMR